jgi:hypothetical protein
MNIWWFDEDVFGIFFCDIKYLNADSVVLAHCENCLNKEGTGGIDSAAVWVLVSALCTSIFSRAWGKLKFRLFQIDLSVFYWSDTFPKNI